MNIKKITFDMVRKNFSKRDNFSHKGTYGTLCTVCGSYKMPGAAIMAAKSALRCGVGKINMCIPKSIYRTVSTNLVEPIFTCLLEKKSGNLSSKCIKSLNESLKNSTACVIGCGLSNSLDIKRIVFNILKNYKGNILLDADGINAISDNINVLKATNSKIVLTPHPGEMARLLKVDIKYINQNREDIARKFALDNKVVLVLKGAETIVAKEDGTLFKNTTGNPGMARAGMGDVLSGMIASFLAQGMNPIHAAISGVFIHGFAGDICKEKYSEVSMSTLDLINELPSIFLKL